MTPAPADRELIPIRFEWEPARGKAPGIPALDPNVVGQTLIQIAAADRDHEITPFGVVEASKAPDAPLHGHFEWNDKIAASLHREEEARKLIKRLVVVRVDPETEDELPPAPAFAAVFEDADYDSYAPTTGKRSSLPRGRPRSVVSDKPAPAPNDDQRVRQALWSLVALRQRYRTLPQFAQVFEAIDELRAELGDQLT